MNNRRSREFFYRLGRIPIWLLTIALFIALSALACNLPAFPSLESTPDLDPAGVQPTVITLGASTAPTPLPPGGLHTKSASTNDTTLPKISNIGTSSTKVYSQNNGCGATSVTIYADVTDNSGRVSQVWVNYQYLSYSAGVGGNQWFQISLSPKGNNRYEGTIDVTFKANSELKGNHGTMQYQVYAMDTAGNIQLVPDGSVYGIEVFPCAQQGANPGGSKSGGNQPGGGSASGPLTISNIQLYPQNAIYYGNCTTEETQFNVQATIDPLAQVASVTVYYGYTGPSGTIGNYSTSMYQLGIGDYSGDIDVGAEAGFPLGTADGKLELYIQAVDKKGNSVDSTWLSLPVLNCGGGGVVGQPPQAPQISISGIKTSPDPVFYGQCTGGEITSLHIEATIDPLDQVSSVVVKYDYGEGFMLIPAYNFSKNMNQLGIGDYAVDIDVGSDAFGYINGDGWIEFIIEVTDIAGGVTTSSVSSADVRLCQSQAQITPSIIYFVGPNSSIGPGDAYLLEWDTVDSFCGVYLDGSQVNAVGSQSFTAPSDDSYQTWTHTLIAKGEPCNNPGETSESVQIVVEPLQLVSGFGLIYDQQSADLGDGGGDDIAFDIQPSGDTFIGQGGTQLAVWNAGGVPDCKPHVDSFGSTSVGIIVNDTICYKTRDGNYGSLLIYYDSRDDSKGTWWLEFSYTTEVKP